LLSECLDSIRAGLTTDELARAEIIRGSGAETRTDTSGFPGGSGYATPGTGRVHNVRLCFDLPRTPIAI